MESDIKDLARAHAKAAIDVMVEIMTNADAPASVRLSAAKTVLDRAFGKLTTEKPKPESREEQVVRIERVIIDPKDPTPIPGYSSEPCSYREYNQPANDRLHAEEEEYLDQQVEEEAQRAPPDVGDFGDYTRNGSDGWG